MSTRGFHARLAEIVALAMLPVGGAGCCQATRSELVIAEAAPAYNQPYVGGGDGGLSDGGNCREFCALHTPQSCGAVEVAGCGPASERVDGGLAVRCEYTFINCGYTPGGLGGSCGRRPAGYAPRHAALQDDGPGTLLAQMAALEAASVPAFITLKGELKSHGAPASLVRDAERAARDEARHFRAMAKLAGQFGARVARPRISRPAARTLEAIAVENAVEGCVRETFGALVAEWQARNARDLRVRDAMAWIARDEARHAALAWRTHAWLRTRLDRAARTRVEAALRGAVATLADTLSIAPPPAWVRICGLPTRDRAQALFASARSSLWGDAPADVASC